MLRGLTETLTPTPEVEAIRRRLPALREHIDGEIVEAARILRDQPTLGVLQAQQQLWQQRHVEAIAWLNVLTRRATVFQDEVNHLTQLQRTWTFTREAAHASQAPQPILRQIDDVLAGIEATRVSLEAQRNTVLDLQNSVAQQVARSSATLAQLTHAQHLAVGGLLRRDSPPIWDAESWARARDVWRTHVRDVAATYRSGIARYLRDPAERLPRHLAFFAAVAVVFTFARRRAREGATTEADTSPSMRVFERPYSATAVLALLLASSPWSPVPPAVHRLIVILGVGPVIRLVRPAVDPRVHAELYVLWGLFVIDAVRGAFAGVTLLEQAFLAVETIAGIALVGHSVRSGRLQLLSARRAESGRFATYRVGVGLVVVLFAVALVAGLLGYLRLARLLASGVLSGAVLALLLWASMLVLVGVVAFALRVWPLSLLQMVEHHRDLLERRARHVLVMMATVGWAARMLDHVGLFHPALSSIQTALATPLGRGSIQFSLGDVLEFVLTVWVAYLVSAFIRFVLREDVYPRTQIPSGISYAISSLLNYVIIALGFVLALGVAGMDLSKVTVLAGALGVGIGFGLQSIVNNFVSGLILLFERPIHVGDVVDVGDLSGEVSRIGIRASRVRTWQGAEIIVPNAQLVTERVTNWTLSDRTRRIDLPIGVDYGSPPEKVVEMLEAVARAHPQVMKSPAPVAVFMAFGDSAINFELRAWTNRFDRWKVIETELATAVYAALRSAGMTFPFPQREVRLLPDAPRTTTPRPTD